MTNTADQIGSFLSDAEEALQLLGTSVYKFRGLIRVGDPINESAQAARREHERKCAEAVDALTVRGRGLAEALEQGGEDSTCLLKFLNTITPKRRGAEAAALWPDLKVGLERAAIRPAPTNAAEVDEPLTDTEREVRDIILKHPHGIDGQEICGAHGAIELSTLTRHIIPKLKEKCGVKNRRGAGYYIPAT